MPQTDISIDIETLGTAYDAPIIAIGAVVFDRNTGKIGQKFYAEVEFKSAVKNCRPDGDTIAWWMRQSADARQIFNLDREKYSLATTLQQFGDWCRSVSAGVPVVWGNGATFDISLIEYAYVNCSVGLKPAWHFTNIRDLRTIVEAAEQIAGFDRSAVANVGTAHNAVDDAEYQGKLIAAAFAALRGKGKKAVPVVEDDDEL